MKHDDSKSYFESWASALTNALPFACILLFMQPSYTLILSASGQEEAHVIAHGLPWPWIKDGLFSLAIDLALIPLAMNLGVLLVFAIPLARIANKILSPKRVAIILYLLSFGVGVAFFLFYSLADVYFFNEFNFEHYSLSKREFLWPPHIP
jgi:hypothetical protein